MSLAWARAIVLLALCSVLLPADLVWAEEGEKSCGVATEMGEVHSACALSSADLKDQQASNPSSEWRFRQMCLIDGNVDSESGACFKPQECVTAAGEPGTLYSVRRDGEFVGHACLTAAEADDLGAGPDLATLVQEAFRRLAWPSSVVSVDPPSGRTLVNFETFFYTANSEPSVQSVTLLGQQVEVEASPVSYVWHFGDGESLETSSAGAAFPAGDVTHSFTRAGTVSPSVDTTYRGRWRLNGSGWRDIEQTLTVAGAPVDLGVVEARPELVLR